MVKVYGDTSAVRRFVRLDGCVSSAKTLTRRLEMSCAPLFLFPPRPSVFISTKRTHTRPPFHRESVLALASLRRKDLVPSPLKKKNERDGKRWINKNKPPEDEKKKKKGRRRVDRRSSRKKKKERETLPTPRVSPSVGRRWRSRAHSTDKCLQERSYIYSPLLYLSFFSLFLSSLPLSLSLNILSTTVLFCCVRMQVQSCGIHI